MEQKRSAEPGKSVNQINQDYASARRNVIEEHQQKWSKLQVMKHELIKNFKH